MQIGLTKYNYKEILMIIAGGVTAENAKRHNDTLFVYIGISIIAIGAIIIVFKHFKYFFDKFKAMLSIIIGHKSQKNYEEPLDINDEMKQQFSEIFEDLKGKK